MSASNVLENYFETVSWAFIFEVSPTFYVYVHLHENDAYPYLSTKFTINYLNVVMHPYNSAVYETEAAGSKI